MLRMVDSVKIDVLQKGVDMGVTFAIFLIGGQNCNFCKLRGQKVCFSLLENGEKVINLTF